MQIVKISEVKPNPKNPRIIKDGKFQKLVKSIQEFPDMLNKRPLIVFTDVDGKYCVLGGNMRLKACKEIGLKEIPIIVADEWTEEQKNEFLIKDNVGFGEWDWDSLANEWDVEKLDNWGLDLPIDLSIQEEDKEVIAHGKLQETFLIPPFSILDTRQGYWNDRKRYWKEIINDNGESRENTLANGSIMAEMNNGVSILDPVLAEITNKWFGLEKCNTFDCFAGDTVFGYVSSYLGNKFTGIELRKEQADLNNARVKGFNANYICDDGRNVLNYIKENSQDLLFSCPPYFDLEVYSDLENDASNQDTYEEFIEIIEDAFSKAVKCLKENRFAVITVGDVRDKDGYYYNFIDDIKRIFIKNGMKLYNELILIESIGTLPQRVGRFMEHRKIGKCHQNVLVFYKGNTKEIKNIFPKIEVDESANI
jgi:hypothetical protein